MGEYISSPQLRISESYISCGVAECHHFPNKTGNSLLFTIANRLYHKANPRPVAHLIWSDSKNNGRAKKLEDYIEEHSLGSIVSQTTISPKTGSVITTTIYQPDHEKLKAWYTKQVMEVLTID